MSGVEHLEDHISPSWNWAAELTGQLMLTHLVAGSNADRATRRHGVPSVEHQIHQHLLQLTPITDHRVGGGVELEPQANMLSDQSLQHAADLIHRTYDPNRIDECLDVFACRGAPSAGNDPP